MKISTIPPILVSLTITQAAVSYSIDGFDGGTTLGTVYGDYELTETGGNANFLRWVFEITDDFDNDGIDETLTQRLNVRIYNSDFDGSTFTVGSAASGTNNRVTFGGHGDPFAAIEVDRSYRFSSALIGTLSGGGSIAQTQPFLSSINLATGGDYVLVDFDDLSNFVTSTGGTEDTSFVGETGAFYVYNNGSTAAVLEQSSSDAITYTVTPPVTSVPEPSALALLGLSSVAFVSRRKK